MLYLRLLFRILKTSPYYFIAVLTSLAIFSIIVWLPNSSLIAKVWLSDGVTWLEKLTFLFTLYAAIGSNFSLFSAISTILIVVLFGVQIALLVYYIKRARVGRKSSGAPMVGIGGLISGLFGIGCASCGTFIFMSLLTMVGAGGSLAFLPLKGEEFGMIGIGLLLYANYLLLKKINDPLVCTT